MATVKQKERKRGALQRLEAQLASGVKPKRIASDRPGKRYKTSDETELLSDKDKSRISKQIDSLKKKTA